jgi:hypothetical protein
MAGLLGEERQDDEAQIALLKEASAASAALATAKAAASAMFVLMPVVMSLTGEGVVVVSEKSHCASLIRYKLDVSNN